MVHAGSWTSSEFHQFFGCFIYCLKFQLSQENILRNSSAVYEIITLIIFWSFKEVLSSVNISFMKDRVSWKAIIL